MGNTFETAPELLQWYQANGRSLPWRETRDPYLIWISEVILQQTRVAQGLEYYKRFTARFPDVRTLALAQEDEVLLHWQGLGYYSRARSLHAAARDIMERFGGFFPTAHSEVLSLKGIGDYTAAAICSIAYGKPYAVVDGNVYRVLARLFGVTLPVDSTAGKKYFAALALSLLEKGNPGAYNQAIMDFGALQCTPASPQCSTCPFAAKCVALCCGQVSQLPVKSQKTKTLPRYFHYLHIGCGTDTLLHRREGKDIWRGLYEFPMIETDTPLTPDKFLASEDFQTFLAASRIMYAPKVTIMPKHVLSHRIIYATFYRIEVDRLSETMKKQVVCKEDSISKYAVCRLIDSYLKKHTTSK